MGAKTSIFSVEFPEFIPQVPLQTAYYVSQSQFYNFLQESFLKPNRYVFYDVRGRDAFTSNTIRNAVWAWEGNTFPVNIDKGKNTKPIQAGRPKTASADNKSAEEFSPEFCQFIKDESKGKTVVAFTDDKHIKHLHTFLRHLIDIGSEARLFCALKGCLSKLKKSRYNIVFKSANVFPEGPVEILPPKKLKASGPALFVSGVDILGRQSALLLHFRITVVINLSSISLKILQGVLLEVFSVKFGTFDLPKVVTCIRNHVRRNRVVLVVDDFKGQQYAVGVCVAYLVQEGVSITQAIQFVKEKKPSADMNHLMAVHSELPNMHPQKSVLTKIFDRRAAYGTFIPLNQLDKGDEEDAQIVEEIIEKYVPDTPTEQNVGEGISQKNALVETDSVLDELSHVTSPIHEAEVTPTHKTPKRFLVSSSLKIAKPVGSDLQPGHSNEDSAKMMKKKSLGKNALYKAGDNVSSWPDDLEDTPGTKPLVLVGDDAALEAQYYEVVQVDEDANIECGVVYHAEDGTAYYYEEFDADEELYDTEMDSHVPIYNNANGYNNYEEDLEGIEQSAFEDAYN